MNSRIMYIELKSGYSDNGPARIGRLTFSKSGRSVYYGRRRFQKYNGVFGNYLDVDTDEEYWISGVKQDRQDRHWVGFGPVEIDEDVKSEDLSLVGAK